MQPNSGNDKQLQATRQLLFFRDTSKLVFRMHRAPRTNRSIPEPCKVSPSAVPPPKTLHNATSGRPRKKSLCWQRKCGPTHHIQHVKHSYNQATEAKMFEQLRDEAYSQACAAWRVLNEPCSNLQHCLPACWNAIGTLKGINDAAAMIASTMPLVAIIQKEKYSKTEHPEHPAYTTIERKSVRNCLYLSTFRTRLDCSIC